MCSVTSCFVLYSWLTAFYRRPYTFLWRSNHKPVWVVKLEGVMCMDKRILLTFKLFSISMKHEQNTIRKIIGWMIVCKYCLRRLWYTMCILYLVFIINKMWNLSMYKMIVIIYHFDKSCMVYIYLVTAASI